MLDRSRDRRRAQARARQRRHAARARRGIAICEVEYDRHLVDALVARSHLTERETSDRKAVGRAITAALRILVTR